MSDALRRAIRTWLQTFVGVILASGVLSAMSETGMVDWAVLKKAAVSAAVAGAVAVLAFGQNYLEDKGSIPSLLKAEASSGANPITHDPVD